MINSKLKIFVAFKNGRLSLCISEVDNPNKRNYFSIENKLRAFVKGDFDPKTGLFSEDGKNARQNNRIILDLLAKYGKMLKENKPKSGKEFLAMLKGVASDAQNDTEAYEPERKRHTLKSYVEYLSGLTVFRPGRLPSRAANSFKTVVNILKDEPMFNVWLDTFDKKSQREFRKMLLAKYPKSFAHVMDRISNAVNRACKEDFTDYNCDSGWRDEIPVKEVDIEKAIKGISVFSEEEIERFYEMSGKQKRQTHNLYIDVCLFMYEMKMRPIDVVKLRKSEVSDGYVVYMPFKKKNFKDRQKSIVRTPINERADEILKRYWKSLKTDYVFPVKGNELGLDYSDPEEFLIFAKRATTFTLVVASYLKTIDWIGRDRAKMYTFRHSAFTHEINRNEKPLMQIAKEGGTSVKMLEDHYYNHIVK